MDGKAIKVLLVEDNPGDARLIREMLAEAWGRGFALEWAPKLAAGLERLNRGGIDLVLLDLGLPDSSGLDTFAKAHAQAPQVAIVVLTGLADETLAFTAVREGAQDYLFKGEINPQLLRRTIRYARERKQAEENLRESERNLRYLASKLLTAQERERERISRDLHDDLGQSLTVLKLQFKAVARELPSDLSGARNDLEAGINYIDTIVENVRRLAKDLRPSILEDLGLPVALKHLFNNFGRHYDIELSVKMEDIEDLFSPEGQLLIYRIFQEALTNIAKYAQATQVSINIKRQQQDTVFIIEDNGKGFDVNRVLASDSGQRGLGLSAMEERVNMLGGSLEIWSQEDQGTRISLTVPFNR